MAATDTKTNLETGAVLLGAGIGAVGALMLNPFVMGAGALISALVTGKKISDKSKEQGKIGKSSKTSTAACL